MELISRPVANWLAIQPSVFLIQPRYWLIIQICLQKRQWLADSLASFNADRENIWAEVELKQKQVGVDKNHRGYVYWADENMAPVYAWPETKAFMVDCALESYAGKGGVREKGSCAVCGSHDVKVYGNYAVLACYNLNNPGSIAGGFQAHQAHRNFPVCGEIARYPFPIR